MSTEQTETKWRLLNSGESIRAGDEYLNESWTDDDGVLQDAQWVEITSGNECYFNARRDGEVFRRRMTGAEVHGEELLEGCEFASAYIDSLPPKVLGLINEAIAKAKS